MAHKITFFGLGLMGNPMCERLVNAGHSVTVWNRTKSKAEEFQKQLGNFSVQIADTPEQGIEASEVIIAMLFDKEAFDRTILPHESALKGKTVIQMGTLSSDENSQLSQKIQALGATFIEAPVLGTDTVAKVGKLQILIGAPSEDVVKTFESVWTPMGTPHYLGDVTSASTMKLALNNLVVGQTALFATSMALVGKSQLSQEKFLSILKNSAVFCQYYDFKFKPMVTHSYTGTNLHFDMKAAAKDMKFVQQKLESLNIDASMQKGTSEMISNSIKQREEAGIQETEDMAAFYAAIMGTQSK